MGKAGNPNAAGKESRITLRNYLDMSKSVIVEPSSSRPQKNAAPERRKWDMTKSLNAEPGFFTNMTKSKLDLGSRSGSQMQNSVAAANSPIQEPVVRSKAVAKSPLSEAGILSRGSNRKSLLASPDVSNVSDEKELIDAFVDQLRNIAATSSEPGTTTRRVVRKALEFSSNLNAQRVAGVEISAAAVGNLLHAEDPRRIHRSKMMRNGDQAVVNRRQQQQQQQQPQLQQKQHQRRLLPVVEEKQTVISSPITHTSATISRTKLKSVDMAPAMQEHAIECAFQLLKTMDKLNCKLVAWQLKKEFDKVYGPAWHCIVGTSFGSYVTHSVGGFIYFAVGKVSVLLFRTAIEVVDKK